MTLTRHQIEAALALPVRLAGSDTDLNPGWRAPTTDGAAPRRPRPAAVLCGLVERSEGLSVVLTRRSQHLRDHAGQISFPGGKLAPEDPSPLDCALREAEEEIGLPARHVEVLGPIDRYHTSTGYRIEPFVGMVDPDWRPAPDPNEVAEVFETPLDFLMNPTNHRRDFREWQGQRRHFYAMPWRDYYIWGATAGMLKALSDRVLAVRTASGSAEGNISRAVASL